VVPKPTEITITGTDSQRVGQVAAEIRAYRPAGALQGQGREVRQRIHLPQGRQEEVTEPVMSLKVTNARRKQRVRNSLRRVANGRPRLSVFRSSKHIYAQVIDDLKGETLASASSLEKTMRESGNTGRQHRCGQGRRQAAGGTRREERRQGSGVRSRQVSLPRARQGARGCGPRERPQLLTNRFG
jgi:ribosomal protein L18